MALGEDGLVTGSVVDREGEALPNQTVAIRYADKVVAQVKTDAEGKFAVKSLRPGVHQVVSANGIGIYRFWSAQAAPPDSRSDVLVGFRPPGRPWSSSESTSSR